MHKTAARELDEASRNNLTRSHFSEGTFRLNHFTWNLWHCCPGKRVNGTVALPIIKRRANWDLNWRSWAGRQLSV